MNTTNLIGGMTGGLIVALVLALLFLEEPLVSWLCSEKPPDACCQNAIIAEEAFALFFLENECNGDHRSSNNIHFSLTTATTCGGSGCPALATSNEDPRCAVPAPEPKPQQQPPAFLPLPAVPSIGQFQPVQVC
jgi:hypothetical protein